MNYDYTKFPCFLSKFLYFPSKNVSSKGAEQLLDSFRLECLSYYYGLLIFRRFVLDQPASSRFFEIAAFPVFFPRICFDCFLIHISALFSLAFNFLNCSLICFLLPYVRFFVFICFLSPIASSLFGVFFFNCFCVGCYAI